MALVIGATKGSIFSDSKSVSLEKTQERERKREIEQCKTSKLNKTLVIRISFYNAALDKAKSSSVVLIHR